MSTFDLDQFLANRSLQPPEPDPHITRRERMEHRHKIRPVQLFVPSSSHPNSLRLNKGALNAVLGSSSVANRKVVVISVAGAYRKGKSFLLNFFLEYLYILQYSQKNEVDVDWLNDDTHLEGFHWRCGSKRDTVGIWLWGEPILIDGKNGERYAVVLMDTQGSLEPNSNGSAQHMSSVFALSTLLSSVQCYNVGETISDDALDNMAFLMSYGQIALTEAHQFGKPFQKLAFIIRDYKASEDSPFGEAGGQKLMQKAFEIAESQSDSSREIRRKLKEHFDNVLCFLLPHPGQKVAERQSFRGHVKEIRPVFRDEVKNMVQALLDPSMLLPKVVNGKEVTCRKFVECVREYASIFDSYDPPDPRSILNAHMQLVCAEYANEAKITYCRGMDRATRTTRMLPEKKLLEVHIKNGVKALNVYDQCPKIESGEVRVRNLGRLQESVNRELERYKRLNEDKRVTGCASALLACGDSALFGLGLGGAASGAVAATVFTLQLGVVSAGIVAIPISLSALFGIWVYVTLKPSVRVCLGLERD